jgi:hypothetical protein
MKSRKQPSAAQEVASAPHDPEDLECFTAARALLKQHRIHTRDILNGKDFLFSGPAEEVHAALKKLLEIEHRTNRFLQFDYAQIDKYFLLRIVGSKRHQDIIAAYFD